MTHIVVLDDCTQSPIGSGHSPGATDFLSGDPLPGLQEATVTWPSADRPEVGSLFKSTRENKATKPEGYRSPLVDAVIKQLLQNRARRSTPH